MPPAIDTDSWRRCIASRMIRPPHRKANSTNSAANNEKTTMPRMLRQSPRLGVTSMSSSVSSTLRAMGWSPRIGLREGIALGDSDHERLIRQLHGLLGRRRVVLRHLLEIVHRLVHLRDAAIAVFASCAGVISTPTGLAPRRASQAEK